MSYFTYDKAVVEKAQETIDTMVIPQGALGKMEEQLIKLYKAWNQLHQEIKAKHYIFAASNGVAKTGVVSYPSNISYWQAQLMVEGKATISRFCQTNAIPYQVVDVGIDSKKAVGLDYKVARGTANFLEEPAMTRDEFEKAVAAGRACVQQAKADGYNLLSFGEMGIGNTTTSSAVLSFITDAKAEDIVGYGANKRSPEVIARKIEALRYAHEMYGKGIQNVEEAFICVGGFDLAALYGAMRACADSRLPFVIDGFITAVAFAAAVQMDERVAHMAFPSHWSREPGMKAALALGYIEEHDVLLRLDLALGEGTGAVFEVVLLRSFVDAMWQEARMGELIEALSDTDV